MPPLAIAAATFKPFGLEGLIYGVNQRCIAQASVSKWSRTINTVGCARLHLELKGGSRQDGARDEI